MIPHITESLEVLKHWQVDADTGLSSAEVAQRLAEYGENKLQEKKKQSNIQRFAEQFKDVMIIILLIAAGISFVVAWYEGEGFFEPILILLIVLLNAIIGVVQEGKAERALDALKDLSAPHARVTREGREMIIEAYQLVPGDIISLEAGDYVPAVASLIHSASLYAEESALTGV